jgi:hypothetical protein
MAHAAMAEALKTPRPPIAPPGAPETMHTYDSAI